MPINLVSAHTNPLDSTSDDIIFGSSADSNFGTTLAASAGGFTSTFGGLFPGNAGANTGSATAALPVSDFGTFTVKTGAVTFNLDFQYLTGSAAPTQAFINDVETAAADLSTAISNAITLNITIGYGEYAGTAVTSGGAEGGGFSFYNESYSNVRTKLLADAPSDPNLGSLTNTTSFGGYSTIQLSGASAKALGFISATQAGVDGQTGFATDISTSPDAVVGVALHELSHAMGRSPFGSPGLFDLFRYTSAGNIFVNSSIPTTTAAYFSVDGGNTSLAAYGENSDPSDFANAQYGTPLSPLTPNDPFDQYYIAGSTIQSLTQVDLAQLDVLGFNTYTAPCYVTGTAIRTLRGDVAVERLRVGDIAITASGGRRPVMWIGRRTLDLARHPNPAEVQPIRVAADAFGAGLPYRDLWLSPGHSVAFEGSLIPVRHLVNGRSVAQIARERVEYWHVELDGHDVLLAEGLPAESYLDCGNRTGFFNGGAFVEAHPDFQPKHWRDTCLPLVNEGPAVVAARQRLLDELAARGEGVVGDDDAHLSVDGRRVDPVRRCDGRLEFALAPGAHEIALRSRAFVPAHNVAESRDPRKLGLGVARLEIDGAGLDLALLDGEGWHEAERDGEGVFTHRWTNGDARLPAGARTVSVDLAVRGYYWPAGEQAQVAA